MARQGLNNDKLLDEWQRTRQVAGEAMQLAFPSTERDLPLPLDDYFPSPLSMPKKRSGKIKVDHRILESETPVIGQRQAFLRGTRPIRLMLGEPLVVHELRDASAGVWMTDLPEELHQIAEMLDAVKPVGRVLVGGLGLGLLPHFLKKRCEVQEVVIVERSADVIKLIKPHLPKIHGRSPRVVCGGIATYLRRHRKQFDYYLLDTWQGTSESTWWDEVFPLKRIIRNRWGTDPIIHCWAEDIMAGQVLEKLASDRRNWHYEKLPPNMSAKEAAFFFSRVGDLEWEHKYNMLVPGAK